VVTFIAFHERWLRMPPSHFMRALLHYYGVELHHLTPNSVSQIAIFVAVYEGYLGLEPHWKLWVHLFRQSISPRRRASCTLQVRAGRGELYISA
jgi:hypothetical protein